ncbi:MAG: type VI secretion system tube protein Hcp, partial [Lysobacter sp.]
MQHAFLSIDTIKGESKDAEHKDWIEIESFNQDVLQPRSA